MGGQRHALTPLPQGMTRYQLHRMLGVPLGRSGRVRKFSSPRGFDPRTVQPRSELLYHGIRRMTVITRCCGVVFWRPVKFNLQNPNFPSSIFAVIGFGLGGQGHLLSDGVGICSSRGALADPSGRAVEGVGLQPLSCWDCGFESRRGQGCFSLVRLVCCQVEVFASGWSLV